MHAAGGVFAYVVALLVLIAQGNAWGQGIPKGSGQTASTDSGQAYPSRPIRLVLTGAPGGTSETYARAVTAELARNLGWTVVVDSRPGANGIIGTQIVVGATPDGHTLLQASTAIAINPSVYRKLPYDTFKDLAPVTFLALGTGYVFLAHPSFPARSLPELIALAKDKNKRVAYGTAGIGNSTHLVAELFSRAAGIQMVHVPYKGITPALMAVVGGQVQVMFIPPTTAVPHIKAGRVRALGFTGKTRWSLLPDVPTIAEAGVPGFHKEGAWNAWFAPAKTPANILARLQAEVHKALQVPKVREIFVAGGYEPLGNSPAEARKFFLSEVKTYGNIVRAIGLDPG
ncbi:MAG: hypothetical protein A3F74_19885 [Betaproteobacteria bacterium RIFCSPLOWO2_12_FULL_62_58]|nr:MAG: hypothetical protein A3F74_19885 [Betaproteobacteria bacterium RIFCSPLOWO2_12_FULL_62_58]